MIKFFVEPDAVCGANIYLDKSEDIRHLTKVLRAKIGDAVVISDGMDWEYETEIAGIDADSVTLRILDKQKFAREPRVRVSLYQGIPKASKMEVIIQKTVEMGVDTIIPTFMERTVVVDKGQFGKKLSRWQKISDEAVKQCKRGMIPEVRQPLLFAEVLKELAADYDLVICPYENEENRTMKDCLREFAAQENQVGSNGKAPRIAVLIGPEGGFSEKEIERLTEAADGAVQLVSLGKTILRTETAGLAALAMIMYEMEL